MYRNIYRCQWQNEVIAFCRSHDKLLFVETNYVKYIWYQFTKYPSFYPNYSSILIAMKLLFIQMLKILFLYDIVKFMFHLIESGVAYRSSRRNNSAMNLLTFWNGGSIFMSWFHLTLTARNNKTPHWLILVQHECLFILYSRINLDSVSSKYIELYTFLVYAKEIEQYMFCL